MQNPITLITTLFLVILFNSSFSQIKADDDFKKESKKDTHIITMLSMDGKVQTVSIVPDYDHHVLKISCLKDTISDYNFWGVPVDVEILNKQFIEIKYARRAGSGMGAADVIILCVNKGKLCDAFHGRALFADENGEQVEKYKLNIATIKNIGKNNYQLIINVHDYLTSKHEPALNYNYYNQSILSFDTLRHVFYSVKGFISGEISKYNPQTQKLTVKQKIMGNFPIVFLGRETYYFISDEWCQMTNGTQFSKYAPTTTR